MRRVSIDELIIAERNIDLNRASTYLISYPEIVRYFRELAVIDRHHLIIGANLVYGWMPTILNFKSKRFEEIARLVNRVKAGSRLAKGELIDVRQLINNSMTGTSKLLHFANPYLYAIWDSRICEYLSNRAYHYVVNSIDRYLDYLQNCEELIQEERFVDIHRSVEARLGYAVSPYRAVELVLFASATR
jgi:hypothetical protein